MDSKKPNRNSIDDQDGMPGLDGASAELRVRELGRRFGEMKERFADVKILTSRRYLNELLKEIDDIRLGLVKEGAARELNDDTLVIKTEQLIAFLKPELEIDLSRKRNNFDLKDPAVIERIALTCSLNQWLFLAKRLDEPTDQEYFLRQCVAILAKRDQEK